MKFGQLIEYNQRNIYTNLVLRKNFKEVWIRLRGATNFNFVLVELNLRKRSINIKRLFVYYINNFKKFHYLTKNGL